MAVPLGHYVTINLVCQSSFGHVRTLGAQAHGATEVRILIARLDGAVRIFPFGNERDHRIGSAGVKLRAVGILQAGHMACEFYGCNLHPQTDSEVGHLVFPGKPGRTNFAFYATLAETARYQHRVELGQLRYALRGDRFRVDVVNLDFGMVLHAGMAQGFVQRFVAVAQIDVFAHHGNADFAFWMLGFIHQFIPAFEVGRRRIQAQFIANEAIQTLLVQHAGHFVNGVHIPHGNDTPFRNIGKKRDLGAFFIRNRSVCTAQQHIGLNANFAQLFGGMLGGLGLEFPGGGNPRHVAQMNKCAGIGTKLEAHLANGLQERQ